MTTTPLNPAPTRVAIVHYDSNYGVTFTLSSPTQTICVTTPSGSSAELRAIASGARLRAEEGIECASLLDAAASQMDSDAAARDAHPPVTP